MVLEDLEHVYFCRGSAIAKIIGNNALEKIDKFEREVRMWVFEEMVDGQKLTEIINTKHQNVKYLPNITLPDNVVSCVNSCLPRYSVVS